MSVASTSESLRRARPLLGTIVEISVAAPDGIQAAGAAYCAIEQVQRLMSYHDPLSEISRLNARAASEPVQVSPWTFEVIALAQELAEETGGAFDITIAPRLASWGFLPRTTAHRNEERRSTWRDIRLHPRQQQIEFRRPLRIDLGGIAKGYAVDRAVEALEEAGASGGCVNAGGDLRIFGDEAQRVHIRHPANPVEMARELPLQNAALATSGRYFTQKTWRGRVVCPLVDGRSRQPCEEDISVSVVAPRAVLADALTKVVLVLGKDAVPLLEHHAAGAFQLDANGRCIVLGE